MRFRPTIITAGVALQAFEQHGGGVVAYFADGGTAEGDVLIGADGLRSTVRQQCLPDVAPLYAGYVAWRAHDAGERTAGRDPPGFV